MNTITWLHLSDLHFRATEQHIWDENIVLKALLADVKEQIQQAGLQPDFVVVTGDIAFSGKAADYSLAKLFFDDLLRTTNLDKDRLFVVPGNHDVDRDLISRGAKAIGDSLLDRKSTYSIMTHPDDRQLMLARFKGYSSFINNYLGSHIGFDTNQYYYVRLLELSNTRIAILGFNTALVSASDEDKAKGLLLGEHQVRTALEQANDADLRLSLLHHPFDWLREFDRNDVEPLICDNCQFVLHGHMHQTGIHQWRTPDTEIMILGAGACYETREYPNSFNFVRLDTQQGIGSVLLRRYADSRGGFWTKDSLTYRNVQNGEYVFSLGGRLAKPHSATPFVVDWPRLRTFKGRDAQLTEMHRKLKGTEKRVGIKTAGLYGLGGIGKTQLAVEYAYRFRSEYPAGIYWVNAAQDWSAEISSLAEHLALVPADPSSPDRDSQLVIAFHRYLIEENKDSLLVLDNVENPEDISRRLIGPKLKVLDLHARLLITTRRQNLPADFAPVGVDVLPLEDARSILLEARPDLGDRPEVDAICDKLGRLPLALGLAAAAMRKRGALPAQAFLQYLEEIGIDEIARQVRLTHLDLNVPEYANFAVGAALGWHWEHLEHENAQQLMTLAAAYREAAIIPLARLRILANLPSESDSLAQPFHDALEEIVSLNLVEQVGKDAIRLHPLVREEVRKRAPNYRMQFATAVGSLLDAFRTPNTLQAEARARSFGAVVSDLRETCLALKPEVDTALDQLEFLFESEVHHLREWNPAAPAGEAYLIQHIRERAHHEGDNLLRDHCDHWLSDHYSCRTDARWRFPYNSEQQHSLGHTGPVRRVAVITNTNQSLSASEDKTLRLWNLETGEILRVFEGHTAGVRGIAILREGQYALSTSVDKTLRLWDLDTGETLRVFEGHTSGVRDVAVLPDETRILSASDDKTLRLWDLETGKTLRIFEGHTARVNSVLILPGGRQVLSGAYDNTIRLWDLDTGTTLRILEGHTNFVRALAITTDGRLLSASQDKTLRIWSLDTGSTLQTLRGHTDWVCGVVTLPGDKQAVSASYDNTLRLWNLETGETVRVLVGHSEGVLSLASVDDQRQVISGSWDGTIRLWDLETGMTQRIFQGQTDFVRKVAVNHTMHQAISASDSKMLQVWDLDTGSVLRELTGHDATVRDVAILGNSARAISASEDKSLRVWSLETGETLQLLKGHTQAVWGVAAIPHKNQVVSAAWDGTLRLWNLQTGNTLRVFDAHSDWIWGVAVSKDGRHALSASEDKTLRLWDLATGKLLQILEGHTERIRSVQIVAGGRQAISASDDKTVRIWNLNTGKLLHTLSGHTDRVWDAVALDLKDLALSASDDYTLRLWNIEQESELAVLRLTELPTCVAILDNEKVVVGDRMGRIRVVQICEPSC